MNTCWKINWLSYGFWSIKVKPKPLQLTQSLYILVGFLILYGYAINSDARQPYSDNEEFGCRFPHTERSGDEFFFELEAGTPAEYVVVEMAVQPANARIELLNIRSDKLKNTDFLEYFEIANQSSSGRFLLLTTAPLQLPDYPFTDNETLLYMTVACNGRQYPLITVRIFAPNRHVPEYLSSTYEIVIPKHSEIGTQYATDVLAIDRDPVDGYSILFAIESGAYGDLSVVAEQRRAPLDVDVQNKLRQAGYDEPGSWPPTQWPHILRLRVLRRLSRSVYYLNVSATDSGSPPQKSFVQLKVLVKSIKEMTAKFSESTYFVNFTKTLEVGSDLIPSRQILATFPNRPRINIVYALFGTSPLADYFEIDASTARLRVRRPLTDIGELPADGLNIQIRAYPEGWPSEMITAILTLSDVTELHLTYFAQCNYETHLLENPSTYTRVMQFNVKGDVDAVELLNGTEFFEVNANGTMLIRFGADIDREKVERIIVQARLRTSAPMHPKSSEFCQTATVEVIIDDLNDHTPVFDAPVYRFYIDQKPYNNTEVGTIRATDEDKGEFGRVRYRILANEEQPLPFVLFQADGTSTIYYSLKEGTQPNTMEESSYAFTVEAYDSNKDFRTSRASVTVILESEAEAKERHQTAVSETITVRTTTLIINNDVAVDASGSAGGSRGTGARAHHSKRLEVPVRSMKIEQMNKFEDSTESASKHKTMIKTTPKTTTKTTEATISSSSATVPKKKFSNNTIFLKQLDLASAAAKNRPKNQTKFNDKTNPVNTITNTIKNEEKLHSAPTTVPSESNITYSLRFELEHYNFSLKGRLEYGDYIGVVQIQKSMLDRLRIITNRSHGRTVMYAEDINTVEYNVEEGIVGYVAINAITGRLTVDQRLIEDSFEEGESKVRNRTILRQQHDLLHGSSLKI